MKTFGDVRILENGTPLPNGTRTFFVTRASSQSIDIDYSKYFHFNENAVITVEAQDNALGDQTETRVTTNTFIQIFGPVNHSQT